MTIKLSKEDFKEHLDLFIKAQNTPVILVGNVDLSANAWKRVRENGLRLAKKYGFEYEKNAINGEGEVVPI